MNICEVLQFPSSYNPLIKGTFFCPLVIPELIIFQQRYRKRIMDTIELNLEN